MTRTIRMRPSRRLWTLLLLAPFLSTYVGSGASSVTTDVPEPTSQPEPGPKPLAVTVARAVQREIVQSVAISGTLVPREEVLVGVQIEGVRLEALLVDVGDVVKAGDVLARLDRRALEMQRAQNTSEQTKARAEIAQAVALLVQAEASEIEAEAALRRAQTLQRTGNVTAEALQARDTAHRVAVARSGAQREAVAAATAHAELIEAQGREIALKLEHTEVIAPDDGVISNRSARVGQVVSMTGEPLFRIIRNGEVELAAEIPESSLDLVAVGQPVSISVSGRHDAFEGRIRLVTPMVDAITRLGVAKVSIPSAPALKPGRFASGSVETARRDGVVVPHGAVSFGPKGSSVQVVRAGRVSTREVAVGLSDADGLEILTGLAPSETIVARAGGFLRHGARVTAIGGDALAEIAAPLVVTAN